MQFNTNLKDGLKNAADSRNLHFLRVAILSNMYDMVMNMVLNSDD